MSDEFELAQTAVKGSFHIFVGKIVSRIFGGFGGLILIRLLVSEEYGFLTIALILPDLLMLFNDLGIQTALTKYLSELNFKGDIDRIQEFFASGFLFNLALSTGLTILSYFLAGDFASSVLGKPYLGVFMQVASFFILTRTLFSISTSTLIGLDATRAYAILMVMHEILLKLLPITFIVVGWGVMGAIRGMVAATMISGCIGVIVVSLIIRSLSGTRAQKPLASRPALREMLAYGIPLWVAYILTAIHANVFGLMIAAYCSPIIVGNYTAASKINSVISYFVFPISTTLFPMFSKIDSEKQSTTLRKLYGYSIKYSGFFILPIIGLTTILSQPLTVMILGNDYAGSWVYLAILAIGMLGYGLGGDHLRRLLMGQGQSNLVTKLNALTSMISLLLAVILIPLFGIWGLLIILLVKDWPAYVWGTMEMNKRYGTKPPFQDVSKLYISVAVMAVLLTPLVIVPMNEVAKIIVGTIIGLSVYLVVVLKTGAVKNGDLKTLRRILKPQPLIGSISDRILKILERIAVG